MLNLYTEYKTMSNKSYYLTLSCIACISGMAASLFHLWLKNILPSSFWQAFFAPKEHPKIARSFNCGSTPPKNKAPPGRQTKSLREIPPPLRGLRIFIASNPQLKLRAILIRRPATLRLGVFALKQFVLIRAIRFIEFSGVCCKLWAQCESSPLITEASASASR
jgi:hypothetical protein